MPAIIPIAVGVAAVGVGAQVVGSIKAGNAAKRAADYNAAALEAQADDALARGEQAASAQRTQIRQLIGAQRASFAGQNVDLSTADGSARQVSADTAYLGELDVQTITANANREAWGYRTDAQNVRLGGQATQSASRWAAFGAGASGGGSLLLNAYGWSRASGAPRPASRAA